LLGFGRIFYGKELSCQLAIQLISSGRAKNYDSKQSSGGVESITTGTGGEHQHQYCRHGADGSQMGEAEEFLG
jgi:hypothetical protein